MTAAQEYFTYQPSQSPIPEAPENVFLNHSYSNLLAETRGKWELRQLFGNAISCVLPKSFEDVSVIRQV